MQKEPTRVLLVEDNKADVRLITEMLRADGSHFRVKSVSRLHSAFESLSHEGFDVVLLDLGLPDSAGLETFARVHEKVPSLPIVVLTGLEDDAVAVRAVREGAQDFIAKSELNKTVLDRTIRYAIERKSAEEALFRQYELQRALLSAIPAYVYFKDTDSVYMVGNKRFSELSGVPENEIPGKTDYDFFSEADADSFRSNDAEIIATGKARLNYEMKGEDAEGRTIWFSTSKSPFYGPSGEVGGLVGICIDITDQKRAQEERKEFEKRLQQTQKAESLGRMAGAIAHHFNNLLGAVMGNLELATLALPQESKARANIAQAMKASGRAADVSRLMLSYLGQGIGTTAPMELSEVCRQALPMLSASLPGKVHLKMEIPDEGPGIQADALQIRQVLTNLVVNAVEAIGDDEGEVTVDVHAMSATDMRTLKFYPPEWEPKEERYACLTVSDTGIGMDQETLENVFDPFFSTKFTGRGLGLAVVAGVAKAHEGAVTVGSSPGRGAVFRVFLPISSEDLPLPRKAEPVDTAPFKDRGLILLVEDEPMLCALAEVLLEHLGYEVFTAADGVEALELFREQQDQVQCVLLDLTMPRMDGWETLDALRALRPNVPVILSSGYDEAKVMQGVHPQRPQAFLPKPYVMKDLEAILGAVLNESPGANNATPIDTEAIVEPTTRS